MTDPNLLGLDPSSLGLDPSSLGFEPGQVDVKLTSVGFRYKKAQRVHMKSGVRLDMGFRCYWYLDWGSWLAARSPAMGLGKMLKSSQVKSSLYINNRHPNEFLF